LKIGVFGGTFNPPHTGHLKSAMTAVDQLGLDKLIVVPAGIPPHKPLPPGTPSADMRFHMVSVAFSDQAGTIVSDIESKNSGISYTVDTVKLLKHDYPGAMIFLLVGTDMFLTLDMWKDCKTLLETVTPAVFSRNIEDTFRISGYSSGLWKQYGVHTETIKNYVVDISSSQLREMLPKREGKRYIDDTTYSYIISNRLYDAKPDWDWLRGRAYSMLDPARIPHVAGCEKEAVRLAQRWGVDPDDAREAAILHDITKKLAPEENFSILKECGFPVVKLENAGEKLLHSKTGAALAKTLFGVSNEVAGAIMWHTTGKAGMSPLEKVIYVADYIEPTRDMEGVEAMRAAAYEDLNEALRMGLDASIRDLISRGIAPDRTTSDALDDLIQHMGSGQNPNI